MKKRIVLFAAVLAVLVMALASCQFFGGDDNPPPVGDQGDTSTPDNTTDNTPKTMKVSSIVYATGQGMDLSEVRNDIIDLVGIVSLDPDDIAERDGEIVFGNANRTITEKAKAELAKLISKGNNVDCGYIIYKDGNNVAVYWDHVDMTEMVISLFLKICIDEKLLVLDDGVITYDLYDMRTYEIEKYWIALEAIAEPEVVESIRKLYDYYDGAKIADWLANLYDPELGGIYYSRSARDNVPFLPDLESTVQGIRWIEYNGGLSSYNLFPDEIKIKMINFAREMQCADDGYFYHPQWPQGRENLATDRYGRDQGWATTLITTLTTRDENGKVVHYYPKWCASNGKKCELHDGTDEKCSFVKSVSSQTEMFSAGAADTLVSNVSSAVSKISTSTVAPTATVSSRPDYSSRAAFSAWLEAYQADIKVSSGHAHQLAAIKSEIAQHGYLDIVLDHLDRIQKEVFEEQLAAGEEPTGLWQKSIDYNAVWGLLKYMSFYGTSREIDIKYVPYIARTCVKVIELPPDGDYASNDLYNQWSGISNLLSNVKKYHGTDGAQIIYDIFRENAPSLIDNCLDKIKPFRMEDGSFSARSTGITGANIYSTHIALGVVEGNVNSTGLICSMYRSIFPVLGLPEVPLCTQADGERFIDTLVNCDPIDKVNDDDSDGVLTFENGQHAPSITPGIKNPGAALDVVDDPTGDSKYSLGLVSTQGASAGDGFSVTTTGNGTACNVFEADIYIDSESEDTTLLQIRLDQCYMLLFKKSGNSIEIKDSASTSNVNLKSNKIGTAACDEWIHIRVEYYINGESLNELENPIIKVYLNDNDAFISDNFFGSQTEGKAPDNSYKVLNVLSPKVADAVIYFDNIICERDSIIYEAE